MSHSHTDRREFLKRTAAAGVAVAAGLCSGARADQPKILVRKSIAEFVKDEKEEGAISIAALTAYGRLARSKEQEKPLTDLLATYDEKFKKAEELDDYIFEILLPTEVVSEVKGGKKSTKVRKLYPGYVFIHAKLYDEQAKLINKPWYFVKETTGVIGFVGGDRPAALRQAEIDEIHARIEGADEHGAGARMASFAAVLVQIALLDIVFSLDSVITAVGMVDDLWVMIVAVILSVLIMMAAAGPISAFVNRHPTVKILALSFLLLIGLSLLLEGFDQHIPKGYIYFAMGFAVFVEMVNLRTRVKRPGV